MQKRYAGRRRFGGTRPTRTWADVSNEFTFTTQAATGTATLIQMQAPAALSNLTSDPPEDLTVLRMRGEFLVQLSTIGQWVLALLVQDTTWTPGATFGVDSDKRVLWSQAYNAASDEVHTWNPPGYLSLSTGPFRLQCPREAIHLDIAPRVRIECGKALFLVAYEEVDGSTLSVTSNSMRVLFQRSRRGR